MGHSEHDPGFKDRRPWNAGRKLGAKRALKPQQVRAVRFWLDRAGRVRDRALFDLAIDGKLRGCDVVKLYYDLGRRTIPLVAVNTGVGAYASRFQNEGVLGRVGLNYKFGTF